jgi:hypothetical protein
MQHEGPVEQSGGEFQVRISIPLAREDSSCGSRHYVLQVDPPSVPGANWQYEWRASDGWFSTESGIAKEASSGHTSNVNQIIWRPRGEEGGVALVEVRVTNSSGHSAFARRSLEYPPYRVSTDCKGKLF